MLHSSEVSLREQYENDRVQLLAKRILQVSGVRTMVITMDNDDDVSVWLSGGCLLASDVFIGDRLCAEIDSVVNGV